jgi:hypothetical protein
MPRIFQAGHDLAGVVFYMCARENVVIIKTSKKML